LPILVRQGPECVRFDVQGPQPSKKLNPWRQFSEVTAPEREMLEAVELREGTGRASIPIEER